MDIDKNETIRRRAYAIWESEGRPEGQQDSHWDRAVSKDALDQEQGFEPESGTETDAPDTVQPSVDTPQAK